MTADPSGCTQPLYAEMADTLRGWLTAGTFGPGDRLPSIRTLSRRHQVSINTVREAYWVLEAEGLVEGRPQSGFFVHGSRRVRPAPNPSVDLAAIVPHVVTPCALNEVLPTTLGALPFQGLGLVKGSVPPELLPEAALNGFLAAAAREDGGKLFEYDSRKGSPALREGIARHLVDAGIGLSPEDLLVTGGCLPSVALALQTVCRAGDTVAVESPTYPEFLKLLRFMDLRILEIPSAPREGLNLPVLEWALDRHPVKAVLVVPTFNNPTGATLPDEAKRRLVALLAARQIPLIEDDAYGDLSFLDRRPPACKAFDTAGGVIYCSSFSKALSPGYRVGWVAGGRWHDEIQERKVLTAASASMPAQRAVARYLEHGNAPRRLRGLRRTLGDRSRALTALSKTAFPEGTEWACPLGGIFHWIRLPEGSDTLKLYDRAAAEGIFFRPGPVFSAGGAFGNALRLNFSGWGPAAEAAVVRLGQLAAAAAR